MNSEPRKVQNVPSPPQDHVLETHWRELYGMLLTLTRNPATAEDLAQETLMLALGKGIPPGPQMRAWLWEAAKRVAMNELRRKRPLLKPAEDLQDIEMPRAGSDTQEHTFDDELAALRKCQSLLSKPEQDLLAGKYADNRSLNDLAAEAGSSAEYIKVKLFRLRKRLQECVQRRMNGEKGDAEHG